MAPEVVFLENPRDDLFFKDCAGERVRGRDYFSRRDTLEVCKKRAAPAHCDSQYGDTTTQRARVFRVGDCETHWQRTYSARTAPTLYHAQAGIIARKRGKTFANTQGQSADNLRVNEKQGSRAQLENQD